MDVVGKVEVHEGLEHQGGSTKSEKHDGWFKQPERGDEGGLPFVTILDSDVVIAPVHIEFSEDGELAEVIDKIRDEGQGVCVLYSVLVKVSVILNQSEFSILLFDKEEGGGLRGF